MSDKTKRQLIQEQISLRTKLLQDTKKFAKERENSLQQQVKMKREKIRQLERRVAIDSGGTPGREYQKGSFRLYNALTKDARRDAEAAEKELVAVKKENELNIKILEEEIKQLRAEKQIYAGTGIIMKENLVKLSNLAKDFEDDGNIDAGEILTLAMKKIAEYSYYAEGSGTSGFSAPQMEVNRLLSTLPENNLIDLRNS